jgi:hypothetical protein
LVFGAGGGQADSSQAWKEQLAVKKIQLNLESSGRYQNGISVRKNLSMVEINEFGDSIDARILEEEDDEMGECRLSPSRLVIFQQDPWHRKKIACVREE